LPENFLSCTQNPNKLSNMYSETHSNSQKDKTILKDMRYDDIEKKLGFHARSIFLKANSST